jgi:hypothetical protein
MTEAFFGIQQNNPLFGMHLSAGTNRQTTGSPSRKRVGMTTPNTEITEPKTITSANEEEIEESDSDTDTHLEQKVQAAIAAAKMKKERKREEKVCPARFIKIKNNFSIIKFYSDDSSRFSMNNTRSSMKKWKRKKMICRVVTEGASR